jgi:hypothetical protein
MNDYPEDDGTEDLSEFFGKDIPNKPRVGELLYNARIAHNKTLEEVQNDLKIKVFFLESLETGKTDALPAAYATGYLRRYARYLKLDEVKLFKDFVEEYPLLPFSNFNISSTSYNDNCPKTLFNILKPSWIARIVAFPADRKKGIVLLCIFGIIGMIAGGMLAIVNSNNSENSTYGEIKEKQHADTIDINRPEFDMYDLNSDSTKSTFSMKYRPTALDNIDKSRVLDGVIYASDDSWIRLKKKNSNIFSMILRAGEIVNLPSFLISNDITLTTGNAGGVFIIIEGKIYGPIGKQKEILKDLSLDRKEIIQNYKKHDMSSFLNKNAIQPRRIEDTKQ